MKRSVLTIGAVVILIALFLFSSFFGLSLGAIDVPPLDEGITLGLDLVGGSEITYEAVVPEGMTAEELATGMETAQTMLRQRLNTLGYTEANVYLYGSNRIVLEIPNVEDPEEAVQMLGTTAIIEFRDCDGNVILDGKQIESATAAYGPVSETGVSEYFVQLKLTEEGRALFKEGTKNAANQKSEDRRYVAIVMDDDIISTPLVDVQYASTGIDTDTPIIQLGGSDGESAQYLASIISAGRLPFELREAKLQAVGASLGEKSLETAILAGVIGILLVMIFMIVVYRLPGIVACIALLLYMAMFLFIMTATGINLTLPGIAGIILTIGMAVDANVVIYERIREELSFGKTMRSAVDLGFKRAFTAILDSNITTIIAAGVLLWQGTGTILGFAKTLLIGVILSMICMLIVPRLILKCFAEMRINKLSLYGAKLRTANEEEKNIPFVGKFKITGLISIVLCIVGLVSIIALPFGKSFFNLDLDFVGGVTMEYELGVDVTRDVSDDIADIVAEATGVRPSSVTKSGNGGTMATIKMTEVDSESRDKAFEAVKAKYGDKVELISSDHVSASVGKDITRAAFVASSLAALLILIYISIRFELRSGLAAVICLIHDLLVMLSLYVVFQISMNMNFIAAALTIIGYSINATIVVFDRIRENYKKTGGNEEFSRVVDRSVTQTMRRSIGTTVTTLLPIILLVILGVSSIRNFAVPIMVGVLAGGYSSTCIAGPLWCKLKGKKGKVR
ncbi:MAG: protein translocase subunit SecD [Oscillospiraceae bacterium]|nr:protein translocase subunit SecD [Oscillospiraceae bacterium]